MKAKRLKTARGRAGEAARLIIAGRHENNRAFDDCFEMYDGDQVMWHLLERYSASAVLRAACRRENVTSWLADRACVIGFPMQSTDTRTRIVVEEEAWASGQIVARRPIGGGDGGDGIDVVAIRNDTGDGLAFYMLHQGRRLAQPPSQAVLRAFIAAIEELIATLDEHRRGLALWPTAVQPAVRRGEMVPSPSA